MKRGILVAALSAAVLLAGCGTDDSGANGGDDTLVIYSGRSEALVGPVLEQFTATTGIEVEVRYGDTSGMAAQLLEEGEKTPAEVFLSQDAGALGALADEGLLAPLSQDVLGVVPEEFRASDGTWAGVTGRARAIVYNPQQVSAEEVPDSVYDLTDPAWAGRVAIAPGNASFQSFVTGMRVADGDDAAQRWLDGMAANDVVTYENNNQIMDAVQAGQVDLGLVNHYYWFEKAAEVGADAMVTELAYTAPGDPGSLVNVSGVGILAPAAENPDAAALVAYLLAPSAQTYFAEQTSEYPMNPAVPPSAALKPLDELQGPAIDLGDLASLPVTIGMIQSAGLL
jgi:iron(III) transport system substrate-binding protein